jgi:hypothetical protein
MNAENSKLGAKHSFQMAIPPSLSPRPILSIPERIAGHPIANRRIVSGAIGSRSGVGKKGKHQRHNDLLHALRPRFEDDRRGSLPVRQVPV